MFFLVGPVNLVSEVPMKNHSLTTEPPRNRKEAKQRFLPYNQLKQCSLPPQTRLAEAVSSSPLSLLAPGHPPDVVSPFFSLSTSLSIFFVTIFSQKHQETVWWISNPAALPPLGMSEWLTEHP